MIVIYKKGLRIPILKKIRKKIKYLQRINKGIELLNYLN